MTVRIVTRRPATVVESEAVAAAEAETVAVAATSEAPATHGVSLAPLSVGTSLQFETTDGTVVALAGYHHWRTGASQIGYSTDGGDTMVDGTDHAAFLADVIAKGCNFCRIWTQEQRRYSTEWSDDGSNEVWVTPPIYAEAGPGTTLFGTPKFDLDTFNQSYFDDLRQRVIDYGQAGIYCDILLFQGWCIGQLPSWTAYGNPALGHPYHPDNNISGLDADPDGDDQMHDMEQGLDSAALPYQKAYVTKVIETLGDLPHIMWEISNEPLVAEDQIDWYEAIATHIRAQETAQGFGAHPVGFSHPADGELTAYSDSDLRNSSADWIAVRTSSSLTNPPPPADGKAAIDDTDHLGPFSGDAENPTWPWRAALRGRTPLLMDCWDGKAVGGGGNGNDFRTNSTYVAMRTSLGAVVQHLNAIDLASATIQNGGSTPCISGYCRYVAGEAYVVLSTSGSGSLTLDISAYSGTTFDVTYVRVDTGATEADTVAGGSTVTLNPTMSTPSGWAAKVVAQ